LLEMAAETTIAPTQRGQTDSAKGQVGSTNVIAPNRPGILFKPAAAPRDDKPKP